MRLAGRLLFICLVVEMLTMAAADAQTGAVLVNTPAEKFAIAPGGVDMRTGRYTYKQNDLAIGGTDESGGLALTRIMQADVMGHVNPFGNFSDNWDVMITERRIDIDTGYPTGNDYQINVHFGGRSQTFQSHAVDGGYAEISQGSYSALTFVGDRASASVVYTFTATDGTVAIFRPLGNSDCSNWYRCAYVSEIDEPDGTRFTFDYAASGAQTGGTVQLHRVTSSRGYALLLEGSNNLVTKACVLNLTLMTVPANGLCPANAQATATYNYVTLDEGRLSSVTRPGGAVESFTYSNVTASGLVMGFVKPGQSTPWLTNTIFFQQDEEQVPQEIVSNQAYADGESYTYAFNYTPVTDNKPLATIAGGVVRDALGQSMAYTYAFPIAPGANTPGSACLHFPCTWPMPDDASITYQQTSGPVEIDDALGRATTADYCDPAALVGLPPLEKNRCIVVLLQSFTDPEGIKTDLAYDDLRNIARVTRHAKPGSGLPDIVTSATYDVAHVKSQDKPLTRTDGNGNITTYTYDPNHGGVLTETEPAVNGITPQKRYTYAQRYAWISNGVGGYVRAATPVWVLTQMAYCKAGNPNSTNTGCANGSTDEVVTTYDYGPDAGPNNLNLRGTVVDAGGLALRSCTAYDALGNKISETKPRAGLASCP